MQAAPCPFPAFYHFALVDRLPRGTHVKQVLVVWLLKCSHGAIAVADHSLARDHVGSRLVPRGGKLPRAWQLGADASPTIRSSAAARNARQDIAKTALSRTGDPVSQQQTRCYPMSISIQVKDSVYGKPAAGLSVCVSRIVPSERAEPVKEQTDGHGLVLGLPEAMAEIGIYRLKFDLDKYFSSLGIEPSCSAVSIKIRITDASQPRRVSLFITPYSCYLSC
jgi:5-hydroxyisourate hydrolase